MTTTNDDPTPGEAKGTTPTAGPGSESRESGSNAVETVKAGDGVGAVTGNSASGVVVGVMFWAAVGLLVALSYLHRYLEGMEELEVIASVRSAEAGKLVVMGVVTLEGAPRQGARVWAVASDAAGNRIAVPAALTADKEGGFTLPLFDAKIGENDTKVVMVYASWAEPSQGDPAKQGPTVRGREQLRVGSTGGAFLRARRVAPPFLLVLSGAVSLVSFLGSVGVAAVPILARTRYYASLALAVVLMVSMTVTIMVGMSFVSERGGQGDVFTFGFASIFFGSHNIKDVPSEWMLSLTTPWSEGDRGITGFYAPLWVMLVAVVGAGLMTLSLLLTEIRRPPNYETEPDVRDRVQHIIMHQFFIVFAPLGAIFVYQALLAAKAAEEPIAVAIAALGAGATINVLLKLAVDRAQRLFDQGGGGGGRPEAAPPTPGAATPPGRAPSPPPPTQTALNKTKTPGTT
ncbi:MAG: hypothetical protein ACKVU4_06865 [Phycisphaerales bacterium]